MLIQKQEGILAKQPIKILVLPHPKTSLINVSVNHQSCNKVKNNFFLNIKSTLQEN